MIKLLEYLLATCIVVVIGGFTLVATSLLVNELKIALLLAEITCFITLPMLLVAVVIDVVYN